MAAALPDLAAHLNALLDVGAFEDYPGALNGLQVEGPGPVHRIAAAVDAHLGTLEAAAAAGAGLLLVHHGLFWSPLVPLTGPAYRKVKLCLDHGLAVYAAHLPLDAHPELGNTAGLARALGLEGGEPWFEAKGRPIGRRFAVDLDRDELAARLARATGRATVLAGGPERVRSLGIVTGGAGGELAEARGVDTFLTGEGPHWTYGLALELGMNVLYGGHYATETFGVKAVAAHLSERFGLPWVFLDAPSGL
jgi:dinuclear metal center YbgI/SA1388 family protein